MSLLFHFRYASGQTYSWDILSQKPFVEYPKKNLMSCFPKTNTERHSILLRIRVHELKRAAAGPSFNINHIKKYQELQAKKLKILRWLEFGLNLVLWI